MLSIGKRLTLLIFSAVFVLLAVAIYGTLQFKEMQNRFVGVSDRNVPALQSVAQVSDNFKEIRALVLASMLEDDQDIRNAFLSKVKESGVGLLASADKFGKIETYEAAGKELSPVITQYLQAVSSVTGKISEGQKDAAQLELYTKLIPAEKKLAELIAKNNKQLVVIQDAMKTEVDSATQRAIYIYTGIIGAAIILFGLFGFRIYQGIVLPIKEMTVAMARVASDLDFRQRVKVHSDDEVGSAVSAFNSLLNSISSSFQEITQSTALVVTTSEALGRAADEMRHVAEQTNASSNAIAVAVKSVTSSIHHVSSQTDDAERLARSSGAQAQEGGKVIQSTIAQIQSISETVHAASLGIEKLKDQSASISTVVNVIKEVADQTNLLALNAAIEAARAGEYGRGFAVVADEVRKLAERTSISTSEISQLISSIQDSAITAVQDMHDVVAKVEAGVSNATTAIDALALIRSGSEGVLGTVTEIASSIREQNSSTAHIAQQFETIAAAATEATRASQHSSEGVNEVRIQTEKLQEVVARYKV